MASMRVHELAKELNISTKEIIETLNNDNKTYKTMSGLGDQEIATIQKKYKNAKSVSQQAVKTDERHEVRRNTIEDNTKTENAQDKNEEKKSHISQLYFPQNSSKGGHSDNRQGNQNGQRNENYGNRNNSQGSRPNNYDNRSDENRRPRTNMSSTDGQNNRNSNGYQGNRDNNGYQGNRNSNGYQGNRNSNGYQGNRDNNGYQGNRDNNGYQGNRNSNGYQGNRDNNGYQGNRDNNGYQGNRNNNGYQGNRDNNGYQGNRDNNGYQGNRDNNGYQGNRDSNGYQGNRNNNGYQGNRDNNGYQGNRNSNGYQGNRDSNGYQGNRNSNGYQGNRDNNGYQGNRDNNGHYNRNDGSQANRTGQGFRPNNGFRNDGGQGNRPGYQGNRPANGQWHKNGPSQGGRPGQSGFRNDGHDNRTGTQGRRDAAPKEEFIFETKPDARRPEARKDPKKNERRKETETKENLKFVNSQQVKRPVKPPVKEEETIKQLILPDSLTIKELAEKMKLQPSAVVKKLFLQGKVVTINQEVEYDAAEEIALEFNCICEHEVKVDVIAELLKEDEETAEKMIPRPPVVCVMGHVDHGKTSLLDAIRETHVTARESGGITQKIGAYTVTINDHSITFLDTPGHEAFTAMRMRGAQATDIAILVVAADDGVMPQTIEAINHAKAAGVEIIVAVNKIDKPNANIEKVKQELTEYELVAEDWGGSTIFVPVSAHTKEGIDDLLEMILLTAEVHELKANPDRKARGIVIEAELDKGRGPVASILVQKGTLKVGDNITAGSCYGKIRAMIDDKGERVKVAGPSTPVEILGLNDVPNAGEIIIAMDSEKEARSFAETFISEGRKKLLDDTKHKVSLDALFEQIQAGNVKELGLIIKADVQGSVEAVKQSLVKLSNEEVVVKVIHGGVGNINESDVVLASASNAIIIGFNVKPDNQARIVADREKVDLRLYNVIYNAIEDVESALKGMLEPIYEEQVTGHVEIRQIFKASGVGNIAGSFVTDGKITRNSSVRITRGTDKIYEGPISTLKRFKDEVKEVKAGYECGLVFEKFNNIQEGDIVEAYEMVEVPR